MLTTRRIKNEIAVSRISRWLTSFYLVCACCIIESIIPCWTVPNEGASLPLAHGVTETPPNFVFVLDASSWICRRESKIGYSRLLLNPVSTVRVINQCRISGWFPARILIWNQRIGHWIQYNVSATILPWPIMGTIIMRWNPRRSPHDPGTIGFERVLGITPIPCVSKRDCLFSTDSWCICQHRIIDVNLCAFIIRVLCDGNVLGRVAHIHLESLCTTIVCWRRPELVVDVHLKLEMATLVWCTCACFELGAVLVFVPRDQHGTGTIGGLWIGN